MKKIVKFSFLFIIILIITGCRYTKEELKEFSEIEEKAEKNAIEYLNDKYGFIPKILSTEAEKRSNPVVIDFTPPPTGRAIVQCEYNSTKFKVYINGDSDKIDGFDDYQKDEVIKQVEEYIQSKTGIEAYKSSIKYMANMNYEYEYLVKDLYEKDKIEEFIKNNNFKIIIDYINKKNLEFVKQQNLLNIDKTDILLVNYNSVNDYKKVIRTENILLNVEGFLGVNAFYIESAYFYKYYHDNYVTSDYYHFNIKSIDDVRYFNMQPEVNGDILLSRESMTDINKLLNSDSCKNIKQESDVYKVNWVNNSDNNNPEFYIFISEDTFKKYKKEELYLGVQCDDEYQIQGSLKKQGDYYYIKYNNAYNLCKNKKNIKFTLVSKNCSKS